MAFDPAQDIAKSTVLAEEKKRLGTFEPNINTTAPVQVLPPPDVSALKSAVPTATNTVKGYDTNNNYAEVYVPKGQYVPGVSLTPRGVSATAMQPAGNASVPAPTAQPDTAAATVAGATTSVDEILKLLSGGEPTETDKRQQDILDQLSTLAGDLAGKGAEQLSAEQGAGIPGLKTELADINAQIKTKAAEYNVLQRQVENQPVSMAFIIGQTRALLNAKAADIGLLEARAYAVNQKLGLAQESVNRAIDLRYSVLEQQMNAYRLQLQAIEPMLNREEKRQALTQKLLLDERERALQEKKEKERDEKNLLLNWIEKYPDAKINLATDSISSAQSKISSSKVFQQATRLSGGTRISEPSGKGTITTSVLESEGKIDPIRLNDPEYVKALPVSDITKAIMSGFGAVKDLTPTDKKQVLSELYQIGYDPRTTILEKLDGLVQTYKILPRYTKGIFQGRISGNILGGGASEFDSARIVLTRIIARLNDVGMLSDQDVADYKSAMPSRSDRNDKVVEDKISGLRSALGVRNQQNISVNNESETLRRKYNY